MATNEKTSKYQKQVLFGNAEANEIFYSNKICQTKGLYFINSMNKTSAIIPKVVKHLEEEWFFVPEEYEIKQHQCELLIEGKKCPGLKVEVYFILEKHEGEEEEMRRLRCGVWGEQFKGKEALVFFQNRGLSGEEAVKAIIERISRCWPVEYQLESSVFRERKKNRQLREENERLKKKVERLRQKNRDLKYAPGNKGSLKAQEHFQELQKGYIL